MTQKQRILRFIKGMQNEGTIKTFTEGYCYWFAVILKGFCREHNWWDARIVYHCIDNHFAVRLNGITYDITGEIDGTGFDTWAVATNGDKLLAKTIYECCIIKSR